MSPPSLTQSAERRDPKLWCAVIAGLFWALLQFRLGIPSAPYFDEVHYLPAARELIAGGEFVNREHPLLGKELLALAISVLGDDAAAWRAFPAIAGAVALFAAMRTMWLASWDRFATVAFGILLVTGQLLFVQSRIAMLDIFMLGFLALAYWQLVGAMRQAEHGRLRLGIAGVMLGAAMASKWNAVPLVVLPGIAFFVLRLMAGRRRLFFSRRGWPVPGVSLVEAALWLGIVPLAIYALTFWPAFSASHNGIENGLIAHHRFMFELQSQLKTAHNYQSNWYDWVINYRPIWYLYERVDGAQRGVLLIGNPLTMILGLPALAWCCWRGIANRNRAALGIAILYLVSLFFWIVAAKPVQFYYHYLLPSMFLLAALALALAAMRDAGRKWTALAVLAASAIFFADFYPILSAAPLESEQSFQNWTWFDSWR
ncbi:phospholipid carrier-dependent glycosyltransferase [Qipengyuania atrilutea]|uniref:Polyprenol-phosphate-mannose--protein mannosyltransferase n=1 Tax=Qipengyuania atrilutea TaxID=2744473 RepID=A0A850H2J4_9SPHN|nr:phospholipid carrier-dependent glycosyltransferase [Actirhodobacter atriluteus]NVD44128.1 phospholipid carrier-dependent glycosyltransferase [Actirhodobacter atriluteus]